MNTISVFIYWLYFSACAFPTSETKEIKAMPIRPENKKFKKDCMKMKYTLDTDISDVASNVRLNTRKTWTVNLLHAIGVNTVQQFIDLRTDPKRMQSLLKTRGFGSVSKMFIDDLADEIEYSMQKDKEDSNIDWEARRYELTKLAFTTIYDKEHSIGRLSYYAQRSVEMANDLIKAIKGEGEYEYLRIF